MRNRAHDTLGIADLATDCTSVRAALRWSHRTDSVEGFLLDDDQLRDIGVLKMGDSMVSFLDLAERYPLASQVSLRGRQRFHFFFFPPPYFKVSHDVFFRRSLQPPPQALPLCDHHAYVA